VSRGGRPIWVEFVSNAYGADGKQVIQCNIRDITERKVAEAQIKQLSLFPLENPNPVLRVSAQGVLDYTNAASDTLLAAMGTEVGGVVNAEWQARIGEAVAHVRPVNFEFQAGDRTFDVTVAPVVNHGYVNLYAHDITDRKRIDESHARLAMAVEQAAETIMIADLDGTILYANPAFEKSSGYTRAEALGQNPRILKSGKQDAAFYREMWNVLKRGEVWQGHFCNKRKDGTVYEENATVSPIRDANGKTVSYVAVKHDVTHEMELNVQLLQSQKMEAFGLLAGGIAHDFNNILSVVLGYSDIWLTKLPPDAPICGALTAIKSAGERASGLTQQLLAFSRKTILEPKILDLNAIVNETKKMLARLIGEDIGLVSNLDPGIPRIKVDPGQISQVLMNLAVNARDAMPRGGTLTFKTGTVDFDDAYVQTHPGAQPGCHALLSVSDTGSGMTPETLTRIFEPFFTTKGVGKGTGLGLAVVHGVVTQSGGSIKVESVIGIGTTFKIYIPAIREPLTAASESKNLSYQTGSETILIVEDEGSLREFIDECLQSAGYHMLTARGGAEALALIRSHKGKIHLMLTDVVMPGMSGRELAVMLQLQMPELKVLYMSGYTDDSVVRQGIDYERVAFLQKPFTPFELLKKIREELDKK
jgi:PAS domain S-box-containing protein